MFSFVISLLICVSCWIISLGAEAASLTLLTSHWFLLVPTGSYWFPPSLACGTERGRWALQKLKVINICNSFSQGFQLLYRRYVGGERELGRGGMRLKASSQHSELPGRSVHCSEGQMV